MLRLLPVIRDLVSQTVPCNCLLASVLTAIALGACGDPAGGSDRTRDDDQADAADGSATPDGSGDPSDTRSDVDEDPDDSGQGGTDADTTEGSDVDARSDTEDPDTADISDGSGADPDDIVDDPADDVAADSDNDTTSDIADATEPTDALNDIVNDTTSTDAATDSAADTTSDTASDVTLAPPDPCDPSQRCCGADGVPLPANTLCRPANGSCDRAERCNGYSGECPRDRGVRNGATCLEFGNDFTGFSGQCLNRRCYSAGLACNIAVAGTELLPCVAGDPCTTGYACQTSIESTCVPGYNPFGSGSNGLSCDAAGQAGLCVDGACAALTSLRDYDWTAGPWTACSAGSQRRDVRCLDEAGDTVDASLCTEPSPPSTRACAE